MAPAGIKINFQAVNCERPGAAVPQASGLRLSLNMKFDEIDDPDGFCTNVTDKGRWGNGDVEIKLSEIDQIQYVMKFVRQSFEKHMDNGDN